MTRMVSLMTQTTHPVRLPHDGSTLEAIMSDLESARTSEHYNGILKGAYAAGWTLQSLGDLTGVTREAIRIRVRRPVDPSLIPTYDPPVKVVQRSDQEKSRRDRRTRVLGLKRSSPVMQVPVATLNELARLHQLVTTVRGWTPMDDPARLAIPKYGDLLFDTVTRYTIPQKQLESVLGMRGTTFTAWLRNHGYLKQMPSQKSYKGVYAKPGTQAQTQRKRLVVGSACRNGHVLEERDIYVTPSGTRQCRRCSAESSNRRYHAMKGNR